MAFLEKCCFTIQTEDAGRSDLLADAELNSCPFVTEEKCKAPMTQCDLGTNQQTQYEALL